MNQTNDNDNLSLDSALEILSNSRRRGVIRALDSMDSISLSEVSEIIACEEYNVTRSELNSERRKNVYVGLYQCHIPKMEDYGVIETDGRKNFISKGENFEKVAEIMKAIDSVSLSEDSSEGL